MATYMMAPPRGVCIFRRFIPIIILLALASPKLLWNHLKLTKHNPRVCRAWRVCSETSVLAREHWWWHTIPWLLFSLFCFSVCVNPNGDCFNNFQSKSKHSMCSCQGENKYFLCWRGLLEWMDARVFLWYGIQSNQCFFYILYKAYLGPSADGSHGHLLVSSNGGGILV